jgi:cobalt transporter subunit CbtB
MLSTSVLPDKAQTQANPEVLKDKMLAAMLAGMLGLGLIYIAGFAETSALHNAAHDGRHSASFPCH